MKTPFLYGLGVTFVCAVITLVTHLLGFWTDPNKLMIGMIVGGGSGLIVLLLGIILGTRQTRAQQGAGPFTYGQAFRTGFLIALCAGISGILFNFIFFKVLVPDFAETQIEFTRSLMERMHAPADKIEQALEGIRAKGTLANQLRNGFIGTVVLGTFLSLITSAVLKRSVNNAPPLVR